MKKDKFVLAGILLLGFFLRVFQFPDNPPGVFFDEAAAAYDAFSIIRTGADRWGISFPVYLINWGTGQSVLYSYLSLPSILVFGLSRFSIRLVSLFFGILGLPLIYVTIKRRFGVGPALVSMLLLAVLPWHVMLSRWALDANLLPFFLMLGVYTTTRALNDQSRLWILAAAFTWGLSYYAYAMAYIVVPIMLGLFFFFYRKAIRDTWKSWLAGLLLFILLITPILLFLAKNFFFHDALVIERFLPFGIPLLSRTRFEDVSKFSLPNRLFSNGFFIWSGFQEGDDRNALIGQAPIFMIFLPLAFVGIWGWIREYRARKPTELFLLWLIATVPIFFLVDLSVVRFNSMILPLLVAAVCGFWEISTALAHRARYVFLAGTTVLITIQAILFLHEYFFVAPLSPDYQLAYVQNFDRALDFGLNNAGASENIILTNGMEEAYILAMFYTSYPPEKFQHDVRYTTAFGKYTVLSVGRFYVGVSNLPNPNASFTYVFGKWDNSPCANPKRVWETRLWKVGQCEPP
jgi:4-amino-4-deoxy-L-arabinose transferase-like glycosyltransferase